MSGTVFIEEKESQLTFGPFEKADLFWMEKSSVYKKSLAPHGTSTVEFVLRRKNNKIYFVEAKLSSPNPKKEDDFNRFRDKIYHKFAHSIDLFFALVLKRLDAPHNEMPNYFKLADYSVPKINLILVINHCDKEWTRGILDALYEHKKLKRLRKTWRLEITVINREGAKEYGLLKQ
jgi:hypothetical protein